jgi:hypothetical protein
VKARQTLRATLAASAVVATLARADAPGDQYNLFNGNSDIIQDVRTGLTWQREPSPTAVSFTDAAIACQALSLDTFTSGWRVPSYKELLTLVDEAPHVEYEGGVLVTKWIDGNAFLGDARSPVLLHAYWTSSAYPGTPPMSAYTVDFSSGTSLALSMTMLEYVRCVH